MTGFNDNLIVSALSGKISGIVTIDGVESADLLKSRNSEITFYDSTNNIPIKIKLETNNSSDNELLVEAMYQQQKTAPFVVRKPFKNHQINIQISDKTSETDGYYKFYTNKSRILNQVDFGSAAEWNNTFSKLKLSDTDRVSAIVADSHVFSYMSVCNSSKPDIYPITSNILTESATLGQDYNLTCVGSGAPYLKVEWVYNTELSTTLHPTTYDMTRADLTATSVLSLTNYTVAHSKFGCVVTNINFGDSAQAEFLVPYKQKHTVSFQSGVTFVGGEPTTLQWKVTGWPLDTVQVTCDTENTTYTSHITSSTAVITATLTTVSDEVLCSINNLTSQVAMTTVYRVGRNCSAGEYGVALQCFDCAAGYTSTPGSNTCFYGNSSCIQGQYGLCGNCTLCPWNTTSDHRAAKAQDCYKPTLICADNYYSSDDTCSGCPLGYTSTSGAAKIEDCVETVSNCTEHYVGSGLNCTVCPVCPIGTLSVRGAVKEEDCVGKKSNCTIGTYGLKTCSLCPWGKTSLGGVYKRPDCFQPLFNCTADHFASVRSCEVVCTPCPAHQTSKPGAAKSQDCRNVTCPAGSYRAADECVTCPEGTSSPAGSKTIAECKKDSISPQVVFVVGVLVVMVLLGLIMVATIVRFQVQSKYKARRIRDFFEKQRNAHGSYILKNLQV